MREGCVEESCLREAPGAGSEEGEGAEGEGHRRGVRDEWCLEGLEAYGRTALIDMCAALPFPSVTPGGIRPDRGVKAARSNCQYSARAREDSTPVSVPSMAFDPSPYFIPPPWPLSPVIDPSYLLLGR